MKPCKERGRSLYRLYDQNAHRERYLDTVEVFGSQRWYWERCVNRHAVRSPASQETVWVISCRSNGESRRLHSRHDRHGGTAPHRCASGVRKPAQNCCHEDPAKIGVLTSTNGVRNVSFSNTQGGLLGEQFRANNSSITTTPLPN